MGDLWRRLGYEILQKNVISTRYHVSAAKTILFHFRRGSMLKQNFKTL